MIAPILSYNCEIWEAYQKQDFKTWDSSPIEKAHLHFYQTLCLIFGRQWHWITFLLWAF